jgi:hypothetical protein
MRANAVRPYGAIFFAAWRRDFCGAVRWRFFAFFAVKKLLIHSGAVHHVPAACPPQVRSTGIRRWRGRLIIASTDQFFYSRCGAGYSIHQPAP